MSAHVNGQQTSAEVQQMIQKFVSVYFWTSIYTGPDLHKGGKRGDNVRKIEQDSSYGQGRVRLEATECPGALFGAYAH